MGKRRPREQSINQSHTRRFSPKCCDLERHHTLIDGSPCDKDGMKPFRPWCMWTSTIVGLIFSKERKRKKNHHGNLKEIGEMRDGAGCSDVLTIVDVEDDSDGRHGDDTLW